MPAYASTLDASIYCPAETCRLGSGIISDERGTFAIVKLDHGHAIYFSTAEFLPLDADAPAPLGPSAFEFDSMLYTHRGFLPALQSLTSLSSYGCWGQESPFALVCAAMLSNQKFKEAFYMVSSDGNIECRLRDLVVPAGLYEVYTSPRVDFFLWSDGDLQSRLGSFFASKLLRGRIEKLKPASFPAPLRNPGFKGQVYRLIDMVMDMPSVIETLASHQRDAIFAVDWTKSSLTQVAGNA